MKNLLSRNCCLTVWLVLLCSVQVAKGLAENGLSLLQRRNFIGKLLLGQSLSLKRRSTDAESCPNLNNGPTKHLFPLQGDHNVNLKLVWVGKDSSTQLLLTTLEFGAFIFKIRAPSKLYKSTNDGFSFNSIQEDIKNGDIRNNFGILKNQINPSKILLISYSFLLSIKKSTLYISKDGANTWTSVEIPFRVKGNEPILLHPTKEDWILALEGGGTKAAWVSTDFGMNWVKLKDNVDAAKWGAIPSDPKEEQTIFVSVTHFITGMGVFRIPTRESSLWRSRNLGKTFHLVHNSIYSLGIQGQFLFISITLNKDQKTRVMHVSKDNGNSFHRVHVPEVTPERFYAILDMSEGQIFLHVDEPNDTGKGTLFISDSDGIMYTKSLENHFYTNDGLTDFYKVESMRGVFLTHKLEADKTLTSVITFDRGVTWHDLFLSDEQCKGGIQKTSSKCSLHYHHTFSQFKGHNVQSPASTSSALGIIILHGVNGDALTTNNTNVYMSRNGGYNWTKVLDGPHHYAIGDHGNLIVAVPQMSGKMPNVTTLKYSLDQGRCWNSLKFSDDPMVIKGLVTEPNSQKRTFSLWGYFNDPNQKTIDWQVITVNFHKVFERKCQKADYELWYPHAIGRKDGCFLGLKEGYPRVKKDVMCFSGEEYKPEITKTSCKCTLQDLECGPFVLCTYINTLRRCDYGYEKDLIGKCIRDQKVKLEICRNGDEEKIIEGKGYRRVPGDQCQGGDEKLVTDAIQYTDTKIRCKPKEEDSYGFSQEIKKTTPSSKKSSGKGWLIFVAIALVAFLVVGTGYCFWREKISGNRNRSYRYSRLASDGNEDLIEEVNGYDPRPKGLRGYKDESDDGESDAEMLRL